jgi:hypothetical protein
VRLSAAVVSVRSQVRIDAKDEEIDQLLESTSSSMHAVVAFVTFEEEEGALRAMREFSTSPWQRLCMPRRKRYAINQCCRNARVPLSSRLHVRCPSRHGRHLHVLAVAAGFKGIGCRCSAPRSHPTSSGRTSTTESSPDGYAPSSRSFGPSCF